MIKLFPIKSNFVLGLNNENKFIVVIDGINIGKIQKCFRLNQKWIESMKVYEKLSNKERMLLDVPNRFVFSHWNLYQSSLDAPVIIVCEENLETLEASIINALQYREEINVFDEAPEVHGTS